MPIDPRSYAGSNMLLELDGRPMGFLHTCEGGEPYIDVVAELPVGGLVGKHAGALHVAPITMSVGLGMDPLVYQWVEAMLERRPQRKSGSIVTANYNYEEVSRLTFDDAMITEVRFPKLDGSSKDAGYITLTIQPRATRTVASSPGVKVQTTIGVAQKAWTTSNFRVSISGLEAACKKVASIDAIVVTSTPDAGIGYSRTAPITSATVDVSNPIVSASDTVGSDFAAAFDDFAVRGGPERSATIDLLAADLVTPLLTMSLSNVGIVRVGRDAFQAGVERVARVNVELYCETLTLSSPTMQLSMPVAAPATPIIKPLSSVPPVRPM